MIKLKIVSQSLPTRCEVCHNSDLFDRETGYCSRCSVLVVADTLSNRANEALDRIKTQFPNVPAHTPSGVTMYLGSEGLILQINNKEIAFKEKGSLISTVVAASFLLFSAVVGGFLAYQKWHYFIVFMVAAIAYSMLGYAFNTATIKITKNTIKVSESPLPSLSQTLRSREVREIFLDYNALGEFYLLKARLKNGKEQVILPGIPSEEVACYIKRNIEQHFSLES